MDEKKKVMSDLLFFSLMSCLIIFANIISVSANNRLLSEIFLFSISILFLFTLYSALFGVPKGKDVKSDADNEQAVEQ